jgi:four helix bundle protein
MFTSKLQIGGRSMQIGGVGRGAVRKWACLELRMSKADTKPQLMQKRLITFATSAVQICAKLPETLEANHIRKQLLRSGTAASANYAEARGAESRADFIHKLRIVLKELNETSVWLELILGLSLISREKIDAIIAENQELCRILAASIKTAGGFERS